MVIRRLILVIAVTVLALPSFVIARANDHEHRATVLLRNGDRVSGDLEDVENGTVYVRVSLHDQRRLPIGEVALIDIVGGATGLPASELSVAARSEHLVVLRNGTSWTGRFVDIRGGEENAAANEPHSLIFRTGSGEERRITLDQVGRIYFGNYPSGATSATASPADVPAGAVRIPGNATWVPTGIVVRRGDRVSFAVSGQVQLSEDPADVAVAAGSQRGRRAAGSPLPDALAGALIGKVGNSAPFGIGDQTAVSMPAAGQLFLGINDDFVNDNHGEFIVQVQNLSGARRQ